ncbi:MAG: type II toxin-antitoxin system RelE/ParE family toxin [Candidatus Omnitrophota bacterium]
MEWLASLSDLFRDRIEARINRIKQGNYGDHKRFHGIIEIRMDFGKGYRLYCAEDGKVIVLLLIGKDKSTQDKDIQKALAYWRDYNE